MSTPHELRRRLAHGLRMGAAGVVAAHEDRSGVGAAPPLDAATVLGETALLCRVAGRLLADDPAQARLEGLGAAHARLGDTLTRALDRGRAALVVAADPRRRAREALPFVLLGDLDTGHRAVARHLFDLAGDDLGDDLGAADRLELSWLQGMARGCGSPAVPTGSVLVRGADLLHGTAADTHALTRAVLHATDCGLLSPGTDRQATSVADDAESLLGAALASNDLGVVAELLWTWPMLDVPLSRGARHALAELDRAEAAHGFLPGPEHDPALAASLTPADRSTHVVRTSCHTAVAGAVLAAALLRATLTDGSGSRAPAGRPTASARRPSPSPDADPLPLLVHADGPWADGLRALPVPDRVACTGLVLGAELRSAAARRDLARVHDVVQWAAGHGWAHVPSVRQGAALLSRVGRVAAAPVPLAG